MSRGDVEPVKVHRSPPPQNETPDTGQVDRYQREQAYDGTQMVRDVILLREMQSDGKAKEANPAPSTRGSTYMAGTGRHHRADGSACSEAIWRRCALTRLR